MQRLITEYAGEMRFWELFGEKLREMPIEKWSWDDYNSLFAFVEARGVLKGQEDDKGELLSVLGVFTYPFYKLWKWAKESQAEGLPVAFAQTRWDIQVEKSREWKAATSNVVMKPRPKGDEDFD
jgi:hypothetical protein